MELSFEWMVVQSISWRYLAQLVPRQDHSIDKMSTQILFYLSFID